MHCARTTLAAGVTVGTEAQAVRAAASCRGRLFAWEGALRGPGSHRVAPEVLLAQGTIGRARLEACRGLLEAVGRLAGKSCGSLLETLLGRLLLMSIVPSIRCAASHCITPLVVVVVLSIGSVLLQGLLACAFELGLPLFLSVLGRGGLA